jgi:small ligand-binding sensory domain FIST
LVFVSPPHAGALEDAAAAVRDVLRPRTLLGCAAGTVVGGDREVEDEPAVSLWVGDTGRVEPFHLTSIGTPDGDALVGWPEVVPEGASALLLLADPFSFPAEPFLERLRHDRPGLPVVGGLASAARGPGGNRLVVDDRNVSEGAVGCFLGPDVSVTPVVSQGCRPVGDPFTVTRSERNVVYELAGKPALERLQELAGGMTPEDRELLRHGLHLGRVVDERKVEFDRGDFIVRNVLGGDQRTGAIAVGDLVDIGATTQFLVRDADSADEDLRQLMAGRHADGALVFTCNGRGTHLFGVPDHDAGIVSAALPGAAVAGMSCAGELGPVGGRNFLHGFTASVVLLGGR